MEPYLKSTIVCDDSFGYNREEMLSQVPVSSTANQSKQPKSVANAATMRGKKINGRKRHIAVDTNGHLLTACIHAANISDRDGAQMLLNDLIDVCPSVRRVWADQGYTGPLAEWAHYLLQINLTIVKRIKDQVGFEVLPRRWVVERTIAWLNRCRRLSKDFERHSHNSLAWLYWASLQSMLRRIAPPPNQERPYTRNPSRSQVSSLNL